MCKLLKKVGMTRSQIARCPTSATVDGKVDTRPRSLLLLLPVSAPARCLAQSSIGSSRCLREQFKGRTLTSRWAPLPMSSQLLLHFMFKAPGFSHFPESHQLATRPEIQRLVGDVSYSNVRHLSERSPFGGWFFQKLNLCSSGSFSLERWSSRAHSLTCVMASTSFLPGKSRTSDNHLRGQQA